MSRFNLREPLDPFAVPKLLEALHDPARAPYAVFMLGRVMDLERIRNPESIATLVVMLKDERPEVRCDTVEALGRIGERSAIPALTEALSDEDVTVRWEAAYVLWKFGDSSMLPILERIFEERDLRRSVFVGSEKRLRQFREITPASRTKIVSALFDALRDKDAQDEIAIFLLAHDCIQSMGDSNTLPRKILAEPGFTAAERVELLEKLRGLRRAGGGHLFQIPRTMDLCTTVLKEEDPATRAGAEAVLASLTLLRGSSEADRNLSHQLVRPVEAGGLSTPPEQLLRATDQTQETLDP